MTLVDNTVAGRGLPAIFNDTRPQVLLTGSSSVSRILFVFEQDWLERLVRLSADACYGPVGIASTGQLVGRIKQTDGTFLGAP